MAVDKAMQALRLAIEVAVKTVAALAAIAHCSKSVTKAATNAEQKKRSDSSSNEQEANDGKAASKLKLAPKWSRRRATTTIRRSDWLSADLCSCRALALLLSN